MPERPSGYLQTVAPMQDAAAQAEMAGIQMAHQAVEQEKQRAHQAGLQASQQEWQAGQTRLGQIFQALQAEEQRQFQAPGMVADIAAKSPSTLGAFYMPTDAAAINQQRIQQMGGPETLMRGAEIGGGGGPGAVQGFTPAPSRTQDEINAERQKRAGMVRSAGGVTPQGFPRVSAPFAYSVTKPGEPMAPPKPARPAPQEDYRKTEKAFYDGIAAAEKRARISAGARYAGIDAQYRRDVIAEARKEFDDDQRRRDDARMTVERAKTDALEQMIKEVREGTRETITPEDVKAAEETAARSALTQLGVEFNEKPQTTPGGTFKYALRGKSAREVLDKALNTPPDFDRMIKGAKNRLGPPGQGSVRETGPSVSVSGNTPEEAARLAREAFDALPKAKQTPQEAQEAARKAASTHYSSEWKDWSEAERNAAIDEFLDYMKGAGGKK